MTSAPADGSTARTGTPRESLTSPSERSSRKTPAFTYESKAAVPDAAKRIYENLLSIVVPNVTVSDLLAISPDFFEAHSNLGNALKDQGRFAESIAAYQRAIAADHCAASGANYNPGDQANFTAGVFLATSPETTLCGVLQQDVGLLDDVADPGFHALRGDAPFGPIEVEWKEGGRLRTRAVRSALARILASPEMIRQLRDQGAEAKPSAPQEFTVFIREKIRIARQVAAFAAIRAE